MSELQQMLSREPNLELARKLKIAIWILTVVVLGLVGVMRRVKLPLPEGYDLGFLPPVHAALNTCVALFLITALVMIKRGNVLRHTQFISAAMICSIVFLLCYVCYHFTTEETKYGGEGIAKTVYLTLLLSHIVMAAVSLPFILYTWMYGFTAQFGKHRKMAKWVFPMWLYVAITGPICYTMLRPYY